MADDPLHTLFVDMHAWLYRYAASRTSHANAEEAVADAFLAAVRQRDDLPASRSEQRAWLVTVTRRRLVDIQRRQARRDRAERRSLDAGIPLVDDPALQVEHADAARRLHKHLAPRDQELLQLSAWDGLSSAEIAAVLGISPTAASTRLFRLRLKLAAWSRLPHPDEDDDVVIVTRPATKPAVPERKRS